MWVALRDYIVPHYEKLVTNLWLIYLTRSRSELCATIGNAVQRQANATTALIALIGAPRRRLAKFHGEACLQCPAGGNCGLSERRALRHFDTSKHVGNQGFNARFVCGIFVGKTAYKEAFFLFQFYPETHHERR